MRVVGPEEDRREEDRLEVDRPEGDRLAVHMVSWSAEW